MTDKKFDIRKIPLEELMHVSAGKVLGVFEDKDCHELGTNRILVVTEQNGSIYTHRVGTNGMSAGSQVIRRKPKLKGRVLYRGVNEETLQVSGSDMTEEQFKQTHKNLVFIRIITEIPELPVEEV